MATLEPDDPELAILVRCGKLNQKHAPAAGAAHEGAVVGAQQAGPSATTDFVLLADGCYRACPIRTFNKKRSSLAG
jgi:hypothetical protein